MITKPFASTDAELKNPVVAAAEEPVPTRTPTAPDVDVAPEVPPAVLAEALESVAPTIPVAEPPVVAAELSVAPNWTAPAEDDAVAVPINTSLSVVAVVYVFDVWPHALESAAPTNPFEDADEDAPELAASAGAIAINKMANIVTIPLIEFFIYFTFLFYIS